MSRTHVILTGLFLLLVAVVVAFGQGAGGPATGSEEDLPSSEERERIVRFWDLHREAGRHRAAGDFEGAIRLYEAALRLDKRHEDALYYLSNAYLATGRIEDAERALRDLVTLHPRSARGLVRRGELHLCFDDLRVFDPEAAVTSFSQALALNPEETGPMLRLGQAALARRRPEDARRWFEAVIGTHASSIEAHFLLGFLDWKDGDIAAADARYERVRSLLAETRTDPVVGEGDRKQGAAIRPGEQQTCPLMLDLLTGPLSTTTPVPPAKAYAETDETLRRLASRTASPIGR